MDRRDKPRLRYESLTQASARTGLSTQDLRRFIANGQLSAYRCGARIIRVDPREVELLSTRACCISVNEHLDTVDRRDLSVAVGDSLRVPIGQDRGCLTVSAGLRW